MSKPTTDEVLQILALNIPDDPDQFNSETGYGEPQHWIELLNGRSLEITYEETGDDNRYYTWRVHCSEEEFDNDDFHSTMGVVDQLTSNDLSLETRLKRLKWAIEVSKA